MLHKSGFVSPHNVDLYTLFQKLEQPTSVVVVVVAVAKLRGRSTLSVDVRATQLSAWLTPSQGGTMFRQFTVRIGLDERGCLFQFATCRATGDPVQARQTGRFVGPSRVPGSAVGVSPSIFCLVEKGLFLCQDGGLACQEIRTG